MFDESYFNISLTLPCNRDGTTLTRVKKRMSGAYGKPIDVTNINTILDTQLFEVELYYGHTTSM